MYYLFGFTTLLLAAAIVALFAMMGALKASIDAGESGGGTVHVLPDVPAGHAPDFVPESIGDLRGADRAVMLVLSTACSSCAEVARQLADEPRPVTAHDVFVVVSTPDRATGDAFRGQPGLAPLPCFVDEGGQWVSSEFNVRHSPSALVFRRGRLVSAMVFNDIATLRRAMATSTKEVAA